ncbi:integrase family protein [Pseudobacteroides cellulosolvens ATCC 35603 = DSM 2933]|uniref:Integrase family protein n=1 Tax=Pseudobacteroides cellulosolvens ATCC 35603 = DSM 2933 TaxID=398512 RepID=A0A0L6JTV5_9FIRM|nr:integrase family protein [Pseudobacteroides cellulosolvens ATCC 35603 = DSM 2933]
MLKQYKGVQEAEKKVTEGMYDDKGIVFANALGGRLIPRNVQRSFYRLANKAGITGATVHSLRHTFATRFYEDTRDLKTLSELLGHANISHTADIYTHVLLDTKIKEIQKIDYILLQKDSLYNNSYNNDDYFI